MKNRPRFISIRGYHPKKSKTILGQWIQNYTIVKPPEPIDDGHRCWNSNCQAPEEAHHPSGLFLIFIEIISLANLHSERRLIPVFPILTIFSAAFAQQIIRVISTKIPSLHAQQNYLLVGAICLAGCFPAVKTIFHDIKQLRPSTSIQAQQWAKNTFERDSHVIMEYYSMPLVSYPFTIDDKFALAESASYEVYAQAGYDYLIVNSWIYGRYYNADEKNGKYYGFYETLFRDGDLLMEFSPSLIDEGPTIRIYRLSP